MRGVREKVALRHDVRSQGVGSAVKRTRQRRDLRRTVGRCSCVELSMPEARRSRFESADRPYERGCEEPCQADADGDDANTQSSQAQPTLLDLLVDISHLLREADGSNDSTLIHDGHRHQEQFVVEAVTEAPARVYLAASKGA